MSKNKYVYLEAYIPVFKVRLTGTTEWVAMTAEERNTRVSDAIIEGRDDVQSNWNDDRHLAMLLCHTSNASLKLVVN